MLNRELRRTGGRVLITLGDQDIDLSPSFVIFLSTRLVLNSYTVEAYNVYVEDKMNARCLFIGTQR